MVLFTLPVLAAMFKDCHLSLTVHCDFVRLEDLCLYSMKLYRNMLEFLSFANECRRVAHFI